MSVEERARPVGAAHRADAPGRRVAAVRRGPTAPVVVLAALVVAALVLILYLDRGVGFYFDEWNFVLERQGHSLAVFLKPHNEHISLVPVLIYKVLFNVVGLSHHWPYLVVLGVMHAGLAVGVFLLARPRVGAWPAVMAATAILFMGLAWQNILWAFQIGFVGSVLGGVLAWLALDRGGRRGDVLACLALLFATASSSLGIPMAVAVGAELLVSGRRRGLWVAAVPVVLYGLWYLGYGQGTITGQGILHAAPWAVSAAAAAAAAIFGLGSNWGAPLLILGVIGLGWRLALAPPSPRLVGVLVAGLGFWALSGAARSVFQPPVPPDSSRYLTFGAIVLLLAAVELARGVVVPPPVLLYGAGVTLVAVALGLPALADNARPLRAITGTTDAELTALDLTKGRAPAGYQPDPDAAPQLFAGRYASAVRTYGSSPADSPRELATAPSGDRVQADRVLQQIDARLTPAPPLGAGAPPKLDQAIGGRQTVRSGCVQVRPDAGAQAVATAALPAGGIVVRALGGQGVEVKLRRFGDAFGNPPVGVVPPGPGQLLKLPADAAQQPYRLQAASAGPMALCGAG